MKMRNFWNIAPDSLVGVDRRFRETFIIRAMNSMMMQAVRTSETSVYSNETARRNIPEGSQLPAVSIFVYYSYSVLFSFRSKIT
jgi:hypothetical protein